MVDTSENNQDIENSQPPYIGPKKNFFALLSPFVPHPSREPEPLPENIAEFFQKFNPGIVPSFLPNFLTSKFIHMINIRPGFQNQGRILLLPENKNDYSGVKIAAFLKILFNRDDADCTVLFLQGHGTPEGELKLMVKEGEIVLDFKTVRDIWDHRTSKQRNKELFIIVDCCHSGNWVLNNNSPDIYVQASCSERERMKDFIIGKECVGSVFLHNLMILNGLADCYYEGVNLRPMCTKLSLEQKKRIGEFLGLDCMKNGWEEFKSLLGSEKRIFSKDQIIFEGYVVDDE